MNFLKYTLAIGLISVAALSSRAVDVEAVLKERVRAAKLPPSDTAILYHGTEITIHADGRMDCQEHIIRYLRTDNAWDEYGDPHLSYDSDRQDLEVLVSRTHTVDGRKIDTTPNGFNPIVPFGLDLAPDFTHYRQMVVTHLGIETDCVTELKYVIRDKEPLYPWAWGEILMAGDEPVLERELLVRAPKGSGLQTREENGAPKGLRRIDGDFETLVWKSKDSPAYNTSEAGAKPGLSLPRVCFTTCPSWESLTNEVNRRFVESMTRQGNLKDQLTAIEALNNADQQIDSLAGFVHDRINVKRFDDPGMLLKFRSADRIFDTGYGSAADLVVLYVAALQDLGFQPAVYVENDAPLALPGFTGDEHYTVKIGETDIWLDPVSGHISYRAPDGVTIIGIYPPAGPEAIMATPASQNKVRVDVWITLDNDKTASGHISLETKGSLAKYAENRGKNPEELINHWISNLYSKPEVKNAGFVTLDADNVSARAELAFPASADTVDGILPLSLPWTAEEAGILPAGLALNFPDRTLPLYLKHAGNLEITLQIDFPESWEIMVLPPVASLGEVKMQAQYPKYELMMVPPNKSYVAQGQVFQRTVTGTRGQIKISEKMNLVQQIVPTRDWDEWRKVMLAATQKSQRTIVLKTRTES